MAVGDIFGNAGINLGGFKQVPIIAATCVIAIIVVVFGYLWLRRRRKLMYPCAEIVDLGKDKVSFNFLGKRSCGWFGKERVKWLLNLFDYGQQVMKTKNGEIIEEFSEEDFQEVNGERGVVFYRHPQQKILFPLQKFAIKDKNLAMELAPADYTNTAVDIYRQAKKETETGWDKLMPMIMIGLIIIGGLITFMVLSNTVSHVSDNALKAEQDGLKACMENSRAVCGEVWNAATGKPVGPATAP